MERLPELKRIRAGSLPPELYGEISEFFSSVHPDFAMSGRTSLYVLYNYLEKAKKKKISARQLKRAEGMIRALCAAADVPRELRAREFSAGAERGKKREKFSGKKPEQLALTPIISREIEAKFGQLGITERKAIERVLAFIGEEEFSGRHAKVVEALPERAYRVFFRGVPDFLTTPKFSEAIDIFALKVRIIDQLAEARHGVPHGLDYTRDPNVLLLTMQQLEAVARLDKVIGEIKPGQMEIREARRQADRLTNPEELRKLLERIGFVSKPSWDGTCYVCIRKDGNGTVTGIAQIDRRPDVRYSIAMVSLILGQAGVTSNDLRNAGAFG